MPIEICIACIGLSFMMAGIAAWQRWPTSRLGLLFTIVGYLYLVPYILVNLANPVAFTIGNLSQPIYAPALIHLGLAWPSGRLRSTFERGVVIADYVQSIAFRRGTEACWSRRHPRLTGWPKGLGVYSMCVSARTHPGSFVSCARSGKK